MLAVVLYHVELVPIAGGFLGVDIFFVISGYLITLLVAKGVATRTFSLRAFYTRRAKRLLPAAYVTIFATSLLAPLLLNQRELRDFALQVVGALTFTANLVLWHQTGYFEGTSELKPLLHTWSLAVEEQYYLLLPAALLVLHRSYWMAAVIGAFAASVAMCLIGQVHAPGATFYLLPTRAWELLIGSGGALLVHRHNGTLPASMERTLRWMFWPAGIVMVAMLWRPLNGAHPGKAAAIVCICTLVAILRSHPGATSWRGTKLLGWFGDISYSLYLVHWPLISLLRNAWIRPDSEPPWSWRAAILASAVLLSLIMHRFVENPVRRSRWQFTPRRVGAVISVSALLAAVPMRAHIATSSSIDYAALRRPNVGLDSACNYKGPFEALETCRTAIVTRVVVWGDSFAMHVVPGLAAQSAALGGIEQATRAVCGPLLDVAPMQRAESARGPQYGFTFAERCLDFNREVLERIVTDPNIRIVVMSSPLVQYLPESSWMSVVRRGSDRSIEEPTIHGTAEAFRRTADALRAAGKRVVFIAPPPSAGFDIGACLERLHTGRWTLGAPPGCEISIQAYLGWRGKVVELVDAIESAGVPVVRLQPFLCDSRVCRAEVDGTPIYNDEAHLSVEGSLLLAERMDWARLIMERAR